MDYPDRAWSYIKPKYKKDAYLTGEYLRKNHFRIYTNVGSLLRVRDGIEYIHILAHTIVFKNMKFKRISRHDDVFVSFDPREVKLFIPSIQKRILKQCL